MPQLLMNLLLGLSIAPRGFLALVHAWVLMDLRGQHYARATGQRSNHVMSPLFWVIGQCLTLSCIASLALFARTDVFFFTLVGLSLSTLVIAAAFLVEFQEVIFDPADLHILGHRPVSPHTYAAARFVNMAFYFVLLFLALNLFPLIVGAGMVDAGPWYAPAYLIAALASNGASVAGIIVVASGRQTNDRDFLKEALAWTQIVLILVVGYAAQFLLLKGRKEVLLWGAFPPAELAYFPLAWLAWFIEEASWAPTLATGGKAAVLALVACSSAITIVVRVRQLYRSQEPFSPLGHATPMGTTRLGGLGDGLFVWLARGPEERVGFWLCSRFLRRDGGLMMRCLLPASGGIAIGVVGVLAGQFANPLRIYDPHQITLPITSLYLIALAVPTVVFHLSFSRDHEASWVLSVASEGFGSEMARGACKAVMLWVVAPLCLLYAGLAGWAWRDPIAVLLHSGLAALLSWPLALVALWRVVPAPPFTLAPARGVSLGAALLPTALVSAGIFTLAGLHVALGRSPIFWVVIIGGAFASIPLLNQRVTARWQRFFREET